MNSGDVRAHPFARQACVAIHTLVSARTVPPLTPVSGAKMQKLHPHHFQTSTGPNEPSGFVLHFFLFSAGFWLRFRVLEQKSENHIDWSEQ